MKAYLYVLNTLADWEVGYITAELNTGRFFDRTKTPVDFVKIGNTTQPIETMGGISITPSASIDSITFNEGDLLILPGADAWFEGGNEKVASLVPDLLKQKVTVAAICGATVALAKHGILNDRKHTSNDKELLKAICPEYAGEKLYLNQPVVANDYLITATGLAPLEFSYEVFKAANMMKPDTLEAWYKLYSTRDAKYFYALMGSLE